MISNRFIILVGGLVTSYFAVWAGAAFRASNSVLLIPGIAAFLSLIVAVILLVGFFWLVISDEDDTEVSAITAAACLICATFFFGIAAEPASGYAPWNWHSAWTFIPVLASIPAALVLKDVIFKGIAYWEKYLGKETR